MLDIDTRPPRTGHQPSGQTSDETSEAAIAQSIESFRDCRDVLPVEAVQQARLHWEAFFPRLLKEMRSAIATAREGEDPGEIAFWGLALLAERRLGEIDEALPVLTEILTLRYDQSDLLIGDLLHEFMPPALANASGEQFPLLEGMFTDPAIDGYARWEIGNALLRLVAEGIVPREQASGLFHGQLQAALQEHRKGTFSDEPVYATALVHLLNCLQPHEALDDMLAARATHLIDNLFIDENEMRERAEQGEAGFEEEMRQLRESQIDDVLIVMKPWYERAKTVTWSTGSDDRRSSNGDEFLDEDDVDDFFEEEDAEFVPRSEITKTIRREKARVGRNEPCPCGSGRKFKKCCGQS